MSITPVHDRSSSLATESRHPSHRPRMLYMDGLTLDEVAEPHRPAELATRSARVRMLSTVDAETRHVRHNVQDAARAVLTWLASVVDHDGDANLDDVLDRCLRPGPNVQRVNYAALAEMVSQTVQTDISPKRIATAIRHLRDARRHAAPNRRSRPGAAQCLAQLRHRLASNHAALGALNQPQRVLAIRTMGVDVLAMLRSAASRVIDHDYGEGIARQINLEQLGDRFLDFVRDMVSRSSAEQTAKAGRADMHRLLVAMGDYDGCCESDMRLVTAGASVVADLMGPDSLPGVMAQLNVLVAGRDLLDTELYVAEMARLAEQAAVLHDDPATTRLIRWAARRSEDQRIPSPIRISSYCLNNAATRILDRLYQGELEPAQPWLRRAQRYFQTMRRCDSGFQLVRTTEALYLTVAAGSGGSPAAIERFFADLGPVKSLTVLEDLARYENCTELVRAVEAHAVSALPQLRHQLIHIAS